MAGMKIKMKQQDLLWADLVKERDDYTCQHCFKVYPEGQRRGLHAHHIFTRTRRSTRWMLENGITLCFYHHAWAHENPLEFHELMKDRLGWENYDELRALSLKTKVTA